MSNINEYIESLKSSRRLGGQVVFHKIFPKQTPVWAQPAKPWRARLEHVIRSAGVDRLYSHQAQAIDTLRAGQNIVVATPTASGKTLIYNAMFLEDYLNDPDTRALYIFPLKALAQDQLLNFNKMVANLSGARPRAAIYDGDTSAWHRKRIRANPPNVIFTNPEMLHLAMMAHHHNWTEFFSQLKLVVIDEVHTYRGVMGSHMAQVFRRLLRLCKGYGSAPKFIFNSATVANPAQLTEQLTGLKVATIDTSGSPQGRRHALFINPIEGPAQTAILLLKAALNRNLRTIVYTQSRKLTELIAIWAGSNAGPFTDRISAYRAGFLPEERREIEKRLVQGDLLAVISTSALELGIDIGDLDLCILVGYPGSIMATWQRGGRVGRTGQDSALLLVAGEDALDQYFMRNPRDLIHSEPEAAVVNPYNPDILNKHVVCAAAERPLQSVEDFLAAEPAQQAVANMEAKGELLRSADGHEWYASRKAPHRHVDLRGAGNRYMIVSRRSGKSRGEVDGLRAFKETHPGAVYLHRGDTFLVDDLEIETRTVKVTKAQVDYYTRVRSNKDTEILETYATKEVLGTSFYTGRLKVTEQVTGYDKWRIRVKKRLARVPLDLPPLTFETDGLWLHIPMAVQSAAETEFLHFMGGIHAVEHAAIGIFPLLVLTDRNDLGGISITYHPQVERAAIFIYDGTPGGAGLCRQAFQRAEDLLLYTFKAIDTCPCESGCPACVHSPKCGSGNRPIDKAAARFILKKLITRRPSAAAPTSETMRRFPKHLEKDRAIQKKKAAVPDKTQTAPIPDEIKSDDGPVVKPDNMQPSKVRVPRFRQRVRRKRERIRKSDLLIRPAQGETQLAQKKSVNAEAVHYGVFDIETQRSAQEVGGWHRADLMRVSCAVVYDSKTDEFHTYQESQVADMIDALGTFELVIGFNIKRFDYNVLSGYSDQDFSRLPTLDLLEEIHNRLGYRLSLDHLAKVTLGKQKTADGLQALRWWKQGRIDEIIAYCREDVKITKELFEYGQENGHLLFNNKAGNMVRVPVAW